MNQAPLFAPPVRYPCVFSDCGRYRYSLRNVLEPAVGAGIVLWVMANPSIANQTELDPTLTRCERFTRAWGFAEMRVVNVRAWIATDPKDVPKDDAIAIGFDNGMHIIENARTAQLVVCGWGKLGGSAGLRCLQLLRDEKMNPHALRLNLDGSPAHPLYLPGSLKPFPMEAA